VDAKQTRFAPTTVKLRAGVIATYPSHLRRACCLLCANNAMRAAIALQRFHSSPPPKYFGFPVVHVSPHSWPPPSTVSVSPVTNRPEGPAR
jgi:hypothetical protein